MARSLVYLYKRRTPGTYGFINYVQFLDPETGKYLSRLSIARLRERLGLDPCEYSAMRKSDTRVVAAAWTAKYGVKNPVKDATFGDYGLLFWDRDHSTYIKGQKLRRYVPGSMGK